jgi:hypothetical protein
MINVNQITSYLAKLQPDSALQQYAMLHKNDPYITSLALAESNRRKDIRAGAQMQAPQQPKVVDQAIQGMASVDPMGNYMGSPLPETVGIGQLPAKNIAKMAGGGIVAFADGGDVNPYLPGEPVLRMSGGGAVPRFNGGASSFVGPTMSFQQFLANQGATVEGFLKLLPQDQQALRDAYAASGMGPPSGAAPAGATTSAQPASAARTPTTAESVIQSINRGASTAGQHLKGGLNALNKAATPYAVFQNLYGTTPEELAVLRAADRQRDLEKVMATPASRSPTQSELDAITSGAVTGPLPSNAGGSAPGADGQTPPPPAPPQTDADRLAELKNQYNILTGGKGPGVSMPSTAGLPSLKPMTPEEAKTAAGKLVDASPVLQNYERLRLQMEADIGNRERTFLEEQANLPKFGVKAEETLKKREQELADDKKAAGWMAILETGLGIMAGTSPFALANIGAGGQKGVASYKDAMKDFKKLQSEYDKLRLDLERASVAEARENFKDRQTFLDRADTRRDGINQLGVKITSDIFQTSSKVAGDIWNASVRENGETARTLFREGAASQRAALENQSRVALGLMGLAKPSDTEKLYTSLADPNNPITKGFNVYTEGMGYRDRQSTPLLKEYTGTLGEMKLRELERGTPEDRLRAMQIRQRIKELQGIGTLTPVNVQNALP